MFNDKPLTVMAVNTDEKIRTVLPILTPIVREGLLCCKALRLFRPERRREPVSQDEQSDAH